VTDPGAELERIAATLATIPGQLDLARLVTAAAWGDARARVGRLELARVECRARGLGLQADQLEHLAMFVAELELEAAAS
jgi:hypothetical protein